MNLLRTIKHYFLALLVCCAVACDDENKSGGGNSPLTPDEHKAKLENIGKDFVGKIKAADHEKVVKSLYNLVNILEENSWSGSPGPAEKAQLLAEAIENNDANTVMTLATKAFTNTYTVEDLWEEGIYTYNPDKREWNKQEATDKIELRYTVDNVESVLAMTYSGMKEYTKVSGTSVKIPAKSETILTIDKQKVLSFITDIDLSNDMYSANIKSVLTLNNDYIWELNAFAKPENATVTYKMSVKGEQLINGTAELTGTKLTDPDYIENNGEDILNTGKIDITLMGIRLAGNGDLKAIIDGVDKIDDMDPWSGNYSEAADKKNAEALMTLYNDYAKIEGFYVAENQKFADIKMGLYSDECHRWNPSTDKSEIVLDWDVQPILIFSDKSEIEFDTFFTETRFSSLINAVETLMNQYLDMVEEDHIDF